MFTTGSKLLIGSALLAAVAAVVYGVAQEGSLGTIGLISAAVALSMLAGLNVFVRDSNVSAMDTDHLEASAAAQATARPSLWPLVIAIGATTLTLGLVTYRAIFVLGLIALTAGAVEWLIQGWSERASGDRRYNADARNVLVDPLELPVVGAVGAGVVVYAFSRVMLGLPSKSSTVVAFAVVAALALAVGAVLGHTRRVSRATLTGAFAIVGLVLVAGGAVAGLNGEREIEPHHSTAYIAEHDECGTEETEADERASQTVAGKSNVAAELIFDGDRLEVDATGFDSSFDKLTLQRANPTNVLFRNESADHARLVVELHPAVGDDGLPVGPERVCTALVEEGGVQLVTLYFDRPSFALDEPYTASVPGSDAVLEVVVP